MKKVFLAITVVAVVAIATWGGVFYSRHLRGVWPTIKKPSQDITELIDNASQPPLTVRGGVGELPLTLPPGFSIEVFAKDLPGARVLATDPGGGLWVSQTKNGIISHLWLKGDGSLASQGAIFSGLHKPHGIAFHPQAPAKMYIAEEDKITVVAPFTEGQGAGKIADLPKGGNHFTRTLAFGTDGKLYVSIGSSCNVCNEKGSRRAAIFSMNPDGSDFKEFARGLRNAVFMATHPVSGKLWVTEMGRDLLGDDLPPDEINIVEEGKNYGWPYCYGKNVQDPFGKERRVVCDDKTPSHIDIPAHSAPLGLAFVPPDSSWPKEYWYNLFVAYHGSWNRSVPTGYKIVRYKLDADGNYLGEEDFITGWLTPNGEALGRPVDILVQPGGTIYISDDHAGVIYRVQHRGSSGAAAEIPNLIRVFEPMSDADATSPLTITGEARGSWFFEATFPVRLEDRAGHVIAQGYAQAEGEWMTEAFVPFHATLHFERQKTKTGFLVLEKNNPSGLPEHARALRVPVTFR